MSDSWDGGKGDRPRPVDRQKYNANYFRIFGPHCDGSLIPAEDKEKLDKILAEANRMTEHEPVEHQKFPKIPRLNRPIIITEKIDGTNAQVIVPEDPDAPLWAGSRNRLLTPAADNYGFAVWVAEHEDELRQLGPGRHFGEWWGRGIQRNYDMVDRHFSLFNATRWFDPRLEDRFPEEFRTEFHERVEVPSCCSVIPVLYYGDYDPDSIRYCLRMLDRHGSRAANRLLRHNPKTETIQTAEGVVIFHIAANQLFKITIENDESPKGTK